MMKVLLVLAFVQLACSASIRERQATPDCSRMCLANYLPVCGSDGRTYGNLCTFKSGQCKDPTLALAYHGECGSNPFIGGKRSPCGGFCIDLYAPVCGTDGRTYSNSCYMNLQNCHASFGSGTVTVAHRGTCNGHGISDILSK